MGRYIKRIGETFRKGDMLLLLLCLVTTAFGCLVIASATRWTGSLRQVIVQIAAAGIGVFMYMITASIDAEFFSEHRTILVIFNTFLLLLLTTLWALRRHGTAVLTLTLPVLIYNLGTMVLLAGKYARFFQCSMTLCFPLMLALLYLPKEEEKWN